MRLSSLTPMPRVHWFAAILSAMALAFPIGSAQAQSLTKKPTGARADSVAMPLALEEQWAAAVVRRDRALFERLLAPGFVYTADAELQTRERMIEGVASGLDTVTSARNDGMVLHRFGDVTAVVTGWLTLVGHGRTGRFARHYRFTDTWVRTGPRWQIVAAQGYLAATARAK